jgi:hypothetical protein
MTKRSHDFSAINAELRVPTNLILGTILIGTGSFREDFGLTDFLRACSHLPSCQLHSTTNPTTKFRP